MGTNTQTMSRDGVLTGPDLAALIQPDLQVEATGLIMDVFEQVMDRLDESAAMTMEEGDDAADDRQRRRRA